MIKPFPSSLLCISCLLIALMPTLVPAQSVSINNSGANPDPSAMLDVQSTTKGILVPRLTSAQRTLVKSPAIGLLVFDTTTESFWFFSKTGWIELVSNLSPASAIADQDGDTSIKVDDGTDPDKITFQLNGQLEAQLRANPRGQPILEFQPSTSLIRSRNLFIGNRAGENDQGSHSSGLLLSFHNNTFVGDQAGFGNTTGLFNLALGPNALYNNTTGSYNTALGYDALQANSEQSELTAVGHQALFSNTAGTKNSGIGFQALKANSSGNHNTAAGYQSLLANTTGSANTALGAFALSGNTAAAANTALGYRSLSFNELGQYNTAVGYQSMQGNTKGNDNTAVGNAALVSNLEGDGNTAFGSLAAYKNKTGSGNTAIGNGALQYNDGGLRNTALGAQAGANNPTGSGNVFLGYKAGAQSTGSNKLYLHNDESSTPLLYGEFDNRVLQVNGSLRAAGLADRDNDTKIQVEEKPDEDILRFDVAGKEVMTHNGSQLYSGLPVRLAGQLELGATKTYKLPASDGDAGEALTTNGAGTLEWVKTMPNLLFPYKSEGFTPVYRQMEWYGDYTVPQGKVLFITYASNAWWAGGFSLTVDGVQVTTQYPASGYPNISFDAPVMAGPGQVISGIASSKPTIVGFLVNSSPDISIVTFQDTSTQIGNAYYNAPQGYYFILTRCWSEDWNQLWIGGHPVFHNKGYHEIKNPLIVTDNQSLRYWSGGKAGFQGYLIKESAF